MVSEGSFRSLSKSPVKSVAAPRDGGHEHRKHAPLAVRDAGADFLQLFLALLKLFVGAGLVMVRTSLEVDARSARARSRFEECYD